MTDVYKLIEDRAKMHGDFSDMAYVTQMMKLALRAAPKWDASPAFVKEGADMIVHKLARALCGDWDFKDHWVDVQGYAKCVEERCSK